MTTYHAGSGTNAVMELKRQLQAAGAVWLGYKAGRNFYEVHPDMAGAVVHGATAARRWWIWIFFVNVWAFSAIFAAWMLYLRYHTIRGEGYPDISGDMGRVTRNLLVFLPVAAVALLIAYCRNIDFSLFKRRFVYKVLRPLTVALDKVPQWVLYLTVFLPLCFPI